MARALVDVRVLQREYLLAISKALTAELDLHDLLRIILRAAVELVSGQAGMIALAEPNDEAFRVVAVHGIPAHLVDHFAPLVQGVPSGDGAEKSVIAELTRRLKHVARRADIGLNQVLYLPMLIGGKTIGLIYVFQSGSYYFVDDAAALLRSFAEQAAIAVRNARLYQQVKQDKQRLDAILEQSADGVLILDPSLRITVFNKALSRMTGWDPADAIGRFHGEVIKWRTLRTDSDLDEALANGWPLPGAAHIYVEGDIWRRYSGCQLQAETDVLSLSITYAPLLDENGRMSSIIANVRDLTRYREEEALQKTFISVISHELKTPVSIIKGYAGTLRRQDANWSPEVLAESLEVIEEESDNLTNLIDNLLEASRLQAGTFGLDINEEINLAKVARDVARKLGSQSGKHRLQLDFPVDFPPVSGDERRLTQVLNNLVSNAIKYSPNGGQVTISAAVHAGYITVSVRDEGIGIPAHERHRIFQKFTRLDNALSRNTEGTGLGLFLTKAIVEAHHGRIWFDDNGGEPGMTFTFSLPRD